MDSTGGLWMKGALVGKTGGTITSVGTQGGGQKNCCSLVPPLHGRTQGIWVTKSMVLRHTDVEPLRERMAVASSWIWKRKSPKPMASTLPRLRPSLLPSEKAATAGSQALIHTGRYESSLDLNDMLDHTSADARRMYA
jgi:multimeric flavodoxin WrbA